MDKDQQLHYRQFVPNEITIDILSRLPVDSTMRFKRVCKAWRSIVEEDPVFHDMHLRGLIASAAAAATTSSLGFVKLENVNNTTHYVCFAEYKHDDDDNNQKVMNFKRWRLPFKDDYFKIHESLTIVGSCNGLICISVIPPDCNRNQSQSQSHHHLTLVCNPLTGEVVNLSNSSINSLSLEGIGFGYLPSTNEYKIVKIYASSQEGRLRIKHVQVYTLGSGRWRYIDPQIRSSSSSSWSDILFSHANNHVSKLGVSVNGALYFKNCMNRKIVTIVSFDLAKEEFRIIVSTPFNIGCLGVLEGRLCCRDIIDGGGKHMVFPYVKSFVSLKALGEKNTGKKNLRC